MNNADFIQTISKVANAKNEKEASQVFIDLLKQTLKDKGDFEKVFNENFGGDKMNPYDNIKILSGNSKIDWLFNLLLNKKNTNTDIIMVLVENKPLLFDTCQAIQQDLTDVINYYTNQLLFCDNYETDLRKLSEFKAIYYNKAFNILSI